jgi:hypothetical protein
MLRIGIYCVGFRHESGRAIQDKGVASVMMRKANPTGSTTMTTRFLAYPKREKFRARHFTATAS